jgi:Family of unknown function (DUF5681)
MTRAPKKASSGDYKVGYGKPPSETRFRKGVSGNPGGRPRGMTAGRANRLVGALQLALQLRSQRRRDSASRRRISRFVPNEAVPRLARFEECTR